jgi:hypothetical protein
VTLDVTSRSNWTGIHFADGKVRDAPGDVDLMARRHHVRAPGGAIQLGDIPLAEATLPEDPQWEIDETHDGQILNPAFGKWYAYSYFTHMLDPIPLTYAVRSASGDHVVFVRIVSYYCKPEGSGCLTLRYRLGPSLSAPADPS